MKNINCSIINVHTKSKCKGTADIKGVPIVKIVIHIVKYKNVTL